MNSKPRVIKDFENLNAEIKQQIKQSFPNGFWESLISYNDKDGKQRTALPYETDEFFYLVRMAEYEAMQSFDDDEEEFESESLLDHDIKGVYDNVYTEDQKEDEEEETDPDKKEKTKVY